MYLDAVIETLLFPKDIPVTVSTAPPISIALSGLVCKMPRNPDERNLYFSVGEAPRFNARLLSELRLKTHCAVFTILI